LNSEPYAWQAGVLPLKPCFQPSFKKYFENEKEKNKKCFEDKFDRMLLGFM
jgi:hypothetical protein